MLNRHQKESEQLPEDLPFLFSIYFLMWLLLQK